MLPLPNVCTVAVEVAHHEGGSTVLLACHAMIDRLRAHTSLSSALQCIRVELTNPAELAHVISCLGAHCTFAQ